MKKIMAVNAGSSSLKFQVVDEEYNLLLSGLAEEIGLPEGGIRFKYQQTKKEWRLPIPNHQVAVDFLLKGLISEGIVQDYAEIVAIGHRVVHGGEKYNKSVLLTDEVAAEIEKISDLAPLHNPANLLGYRSFKAALPHAQHVAVFDTAFHQTMDPVTYLYPLPMEYYQQFAIRRYGFHGTSHRYVSAEAINWLKERNLPSKHIITCHLGNGASLAAILDGKSINTSMGFTPLAGVMMGTRSGDIDPAIVTFLADKLGVSAHEVVSILNKKSGLLGISELSSDARAIEEGVINGHQGAILAKQMYARLVAERIGSYIADLGGLDAIVFTAGLGENDQGLRAEIGKYLGVFGAELDEKLNTIRGTMEISKPNSKVKILVIPTNEELMIVKDTVAVCKGD